MARYKVTSKEREELRGTFLKWFGKLRKNETPHIKKVLDMSEEYMWLNWLAVQPTWTSKALRDVKKEAKRLKKVLFEEPAKEKEELDFPYPDICSDCAEKKGGVWPEGHVCTVNPGNCGYCDRETTLIPYQDFNWPKNKDLNRKVKFMRD